MKNKKLLIIISSIVVFVGIFMLAAKLFRDSEEKRLGFMASENFSKFVPDYAPRQGAENPKVILVEFLDPECESCRDFYPYVKMLLNEHKESVQLVVRYAPFHGNSKYIIKILEAARKQNKYWEALELLFQYQPTWGNHHEPKPELVWNYLPQIGVDIEKIKKDMTDPETDIMIAREIADGQDLNVRGTPTFFVNGKPLQTFSYDYLRTMVQEALNSP